MSFIIAVVLGWLYFMYQNQKTYSDRVKILRAISHTNKFRNYMNDFELVNYHKHLYYRLLLRNPMQLYGLDLQKLMQTREN